MCIRDSHIAERAFPMKAAMTVLAIGATGLGLLQIPNVDEVITNFLAPSFEGSTSFEVHPSDGLTYFGLVLGAVIGVAGIATAYVIWVARPGTSTRIRERAGALYELFVNKWFFDEAIDRVFVRPAAWTGRFAQQTFERVVVDGVFVGGTTAVVRAGSSAVRAVQDGYLRVYAALLLVGLAGVALYFLIVS